MTRRISVEGFHDRLVAELGGMPTTTRGYSLDDWAGFIGRYLQDTVGLTENEWRYDSQSNTLVVLQGVIPDEDEVVLRDLCCRHTLTLEFSSA